MVLQTKTDLFQKIIRPCAKWMAEACLIVIMFCGLSRLKLICFAAITTFTNKLAYICML